MKTIRDDTTIPCKKSTKDRIIEYGNKKETWDDILNKMADVYDKVVGNK
ncbi:hypothetical protein KAR91_46060 [Candidatus Pacearchaeota archaeon]|nr:hypothetical protein [Candidatus Pacearchaeota archaeon]